jgi:hypothetical protein
MTPVMWEVQIQKPDGRIILEHYLAESKEEVMAEIKAEGTEAKALKITQQPTSPPPVDSIIQYLTEATPINEGQKRFPCTIRTGRNP